MTPRLKVSDRARLFAVFIPLLAVDLWCGINIQRLTAQREEIKKDYSEINSIKNGLLSVDSWKVHLQAIVTNRIGDFRLTKPQEAALKGEVAKALNALITDANKIIQKHQHTFKGKIRKLAVNTFVNLDDIRSKIPAFTNTIVAEFAKPARATKWKTLARTELDAYAAATYDNSGDLAHLAKVLNRYDVWDVPEFNASSVVFVDFLERRINRHSFFLLASLFLFAGAWWMLRARRDLHKPLFLLSGVFALILLVIGLASPMIDIDARIKTVDFQLMGEHLRFEDQVLFYRSKSILQVVGIMMETHTIDSIGVGLLLLAFSILFPVCKLMAMELYLLGGEAIKRNKLIHFFAFKSGKWSMADVTVVAIFMAYIGFKGILNNQLTALNIKSTFVEIIATNETSLQTGFILFTAFVCFGLFLSEVLKRIAPKEASGV